MKSRYEFCLGGVRFRLWHRIWGVAVESLGELGAYIVFVSRPDRNNSIIIVPGQEQLILHGVNTSHGLLFSKNHGSEVGKNRVFFFSSLAGQGTLCGFPTAVSSTSSLFSFPSKAEPTSVGQLCLLCLHRSSTKISAEWGSAGQKREGWEALGAANCFIINWCLFVVLSSWMGWQMTY